MKTILKSLKECSFISIACIAGSIVGFNENLRGYFSDRYFYALCLFIFFTMINIAKHIMKIKPADEDDFYDEKLNNYLMKREIIGAITMIIMGYYAITNFNLQNSISYIMLAILCKIFANYFFLTFKFIKFRRFS